MAKLLSFLVLFVMVTLLIPTGLVLASQNSVPGESMYPVKRTLEQGILTLASMTPWTKAYFQTSRSNSRFNEVRTLLGRNENAGETLAELVLQANEAATAINGVSVNDRKKMRDQFTKQLTQYNQALVAYQEKNKPVDSVAQPSAPTPTSQPTNAVDLARERAAAPQGQQGQPQAIPILPQPGQAQPQTPAAQQPAAQPGSQLAPTPVQPVTDPAAIQSAIDQIERVRRLLAEQAAREEQERLERERNEAPPQVAVVTNPQAPAAASGTIESGVGVPRAGGLSSLTTAGAGGSSGSGGACGGCNIQTISALKAGSPDTYCGCLVSCQMIGFCALESICVSKNYCSASDIGAGGPDVVRDNPSGSALTTAEATPPGPTISPTTSIVGASCSGGRGSLLWNVGVYSGKTIQNFTVRINKDPGEDWSPNSGSGDLALQTGTPVVDSYNVMRIETDLTAGTYPGWSVQPGFTDNSVGETFNSPSGFTCN